MCRGRCLHRPEPAADGSVRRKHSGGAGWFASGGELFTAEKFPKCAGGCGPRSPVGLRGVHPRKRHFPGCYAPPGRPVPYCLPLPGFARDSRIGHSLRLQYFSLRPHGLPRNVEWMLHAAVICAISPCAVGARIARPCREAASRGGFDGFDMPFVPPHSRRRPEPAAFGDSLLKSRSASGRPYRPPLQRGRGGCVCRRRSGTAAQRTRDARPYGGVTVPVHSAKVL